MINLINNLIIEMAKAAVRGLVKLVVWAFPYITITGLFWALAVAMMCLEEVMEHILP